MSENINNGSSSNPDDYSYLEYVGKYIDSLFPPHIAFEATSVELDQHGKTTYYLNDEAGFWENEEAEVQITPEGDTARNPMPYGGGDLTTYREDRPNPAQLN